MKSLLPLFAASLLACGSLHAGSLLDLSVVDRDTGAVLSPLVRAGKMYVIGVPGHRYAVHMSNLSSERIMAVLSVDGVNAVSGETANPEQTGYVLAPYQTAEINGWRKSTSEVAQFNFTALSDSYAARTGRANNVGVIGVAVFREKQKPVWHEDKIAARDAAPASAAAGNSAGAMDKAESSSAPATAPPAAEARLAERAKKTEESLGTGHGAREASYVSYVDFERAGTQPNEVDSIWYDSARNLIARGIIAPPRAVGEAQPFPQFVPDPAS